MAYNQHQQKNAVAPESKQTAPEPKVKRRVVKRLRLGRETHDVGSVVEMTLADAKSVGDAVTDVLDVPVAEKIAARKAGIYEVAGPGNVWLDGKSHRPGTPLELEASVAIDLGVSVRAVV